MRLGLLGVVGVVAAVVLFLIVYAALRKGAAPIERTYTNVTFDRLYRLLGPQSQSDEARKQGLWSNVSGKYVRWSGKLFAVEGGLTEVVVLVRHNPKATRPEVRMRIPASYAQSLDDLSLGESVSYSGRLEAYGGEYTFELADGRIE